MGVRARRRTPSGCRAGTAAAPLHYYRFVDDSFSIFRSRSEAVTFLDTLNSLHPNLKFTWEEEANHSLPFLDVRVTRKPTGELSTSVYRKPTWSGLYLHFHSFVPIQYKRNLVRNLFDRSRRICTKDTFPSEFQFLIKTLEANGYPHSFISKHNQPTTPAEPQFGPEKKPVFLKLPFMGDNEPLLLKRRLRHYTGAVYPAARPFVVFNTTPVWFVSLKDRIPAIGKSKVIYEFKCGCGSSYIGRTDRCLSTRVTEHLPKWLMQGGTARPRSRSAPSSAVTRHAMACQLFDSCSPRDAFFKVVAQARNGVHLRYLEAVYISSRQPPLCNQKEFVASLALPW